MRRSGSRMPERAVALALLTVLVAGSSSAEDEVAARRLADTTTEQLAAGGSDPQGFARVDDRVYFAATTPLTGSELWVTDGTEAGTRMVVELVPGSAGAAPSGLIERLGLLYFEATTPDRGRAAWATDGTAEGTFPVAAVPLLPERLVPGSDDVRDLRFYAGVRNNTGSEPFRTDGTSRGQFLLKDIEEGTGDSNPDDFEHVGDTVFFRISTEAGTALWKTDGTPAGTVPVEAPGAGWESVGDLASLDDRLLLFAAETPDQGIELWRTDGTIEGTYPVTDLAPGPTGTAPRAIVDVGDGTAYFSAVTASEGRELWRTDGTEAGTYLVRDIEQDEASAHIEDFVPVAGGVVFTAGPEPGTVGRVLWSSDGTVAGTALFDTSLIGDGVPREFGTNGTSAVAVLGSRHVFSVDGTTGPGRIEEFDEHLAGSEAGLRFVPLGDRFLFSIVDEYRRDTIYITDGTGSETRRLARGLVTDDVAFLDGRAFSAGRYGGLASSDGTYDGTSNFNVGGSPNSIVAIDDRILFVARDSGERRIHAFVQATEQVEVVRTVDVRQFGEGTEFPLRSLWGVGSVALFLRPGVDELWKTDGTEEGTLKVADVTPGWSPEPGSLSDVAPTRLGTRVVFAAITPETGLELFRLEDGVAGVTPVADIAAGPAGSRPHGLLRLGSSSHAVFAAADPAHGMELWITDGTSAGTLLLCDVRPGPESSSPHALTLSGTDLFFAARGDDAGEEPWAVSLAGLGLPANAFDGSDHAPPIEGPPPSGEPVGEPTAGIDLTRVRIDLDFRRDSRDRVTIHGTLPIPRSFEPRSVTVQVVVGQHTERFFLNRSGRSRGPGDRFHLRLRKKGVGAPGSPVVPFTIRLRGDLKAAFEEDGLTAAEGPIPSVRRVRVALLLGDTPRREDVTLEYRVRRRRGRAIYKR